KGRSRAEPVYTVLPDTEASREFREVLGVARAGYLRRDWDQAEAGFRKLTRLAVPTCETTRLTETYCERISTYREAPPPVDWDGSFVATSK
ncbi:MAG: hypothetical protein AAGL66_14700, partial [Pseudomonadota bacterium]